MIIAMDVDDVVLDLVSEVLIRYNRDYDDDLMYHDIKAWDMSLFVKSECGKKISAYFENPDIYSQVHPIPNALYGIASLEAAGHRIVYVTTPAPGTWGVKAKWLSRLGLLKDDKNYIECRDKSLVRADVLVDDGIHNLQAFRGERIIFTKPWNESNSVSGAYRAIGWSGVINIVYALSKKTSI